MKVYRNSTSSSDDSIVEVKASGSRSSIWQLKKYELQQCEFCDKSFINRYSILKHNASHIIIPLIKQPMYQCDECLYHFTSIDDLITHTVKKHKDIVDRENDINEPVEVKLENDNVTEILQSMVEKQVFVKCEDELKEVFVKCNKLRNNSVTSETFVTHDSFETHDSFGTHDFFETHETFETFGKHEVKCHQNKIEPLLCNLKNDITEYLNTSSRSVSPKEEIDLKPRSGTPNSPTDEDQESIRNRLLFEEDLEDTLFKDISSDCKVSLETLCQQVNLDIEANIASLDQTVDFDLPINLDSSSSVDLPIFDKHVSTAEVTTELLKFGTAIHYDYLVEPEVCTCKWCGKNFPSRFIQLQHESKHLRVKPKPWRTSLCCVCERFIAGNYHNLRRHTQSEHPERSDPDISYTTHNCPKCRLKYYSYKKHLIRCHSFYKCQKCESGFDSMKLLNEHNCVKIQIDYDTVLNGVTVYKNGASKDDYEPTTYGPAKFTAVKSKTAIVQLCNMCFSFLKISTHNNSRYDVIGEKCEVGVRQTCNKCKNQFFAVKLVKRHLRVPEETKPMGRHHMKPMTNKERLKKIHSRLKMMKKINKC